jgi:hypothetical protein
MHTGGGGVDEGIRGVDEGRRGLDERGRSPVDALRVSEREYAIVARRRLQEHGEALRTRDLTCATRLTANPRRGKGRLTAEAGCRDVGGSTTLASHGRSGTGCWARGDPLAWPRFGRASSAPVARGMGTGLGVPSARRLGRGAQGARLTGEGGAVAAALGADAWLREKRERGRAHLGGAVRRRGTARCCARGLWRPARRQQWRHSGRGAAPTAVLARQRARSRQGEAVWARNCARSTGSTGFGRCTVGVGELAPWRVGPPEQATAGVEPPTRGARDRACWARHGWSAWAGAGRGRGGCALGRHKRVYAGWAG